MGNCSSALKKKDKDKQSIENGNQCGSNEQRRVSNISVESVAYGTDTSKPLSNLGEPVNNNDNLRNQRNKSKPNSETKTADGHKIVKNQQIADPNATVNSSKAAINSQQADTQPDGQQPQKLNKCMSLNESGKEQSAVGKHAAACPTNSNPSDSSSNQPVRNCYDAIFTLESNKSHIILISSDRNELCVYNLRTGQNARTLRNINRPKNVKLIDSHRAVVLCDRELNVYNLDEARLVTKLKGVMNNKMPFYGLHDQHYAVTLSRNRMYVNMINLHNGNLETMFKVGEDRFLNSLLVSKNGAITVCGDETQKPFPLLVWNLTNRKLIYDLRMPGTEFLTSLSAISDDGHFVVCVCKEAASSSSSNFIVVYDLQSGTLFKKWKPEFSTVSITISSIDNCVINGLENKQIQVTDLSTGAIRHSLEGHDSPVDKLIVADDGEFVLSYDSTLTDKHIRVWSLTSGSCIKSYAPDFALSCCTLSSNGKLLILCPNDAPTVKVIELADDGGPKGDEPYGDPSRNGMEFDLSS